MLPITRLALREGWSRRSLYALLLAAGLLLVLFMKGGKIEWDDEAITDPRLIAQVGYWIALVFTSLLAVFVAMGAISGEVERGTTQLAFVRPVSRHRFWLERYLGTTLVAWLSMAVILVFLAVALELRSGGGAFWLAGPSLLLLPLPVAGVTALVMALNTRLPAPIAGFLGAGTTLLGFYGGQLESLARSQAFTGVAGILARAGCRLLPPLHEVVAQIVRLGKGRPLDFWVVHHQLAYVYVAVGVGLLLFARRRI